MFTRTLALLVTVAAVARAQIDPGIDTTFNAGSPCTVEWKVDPTGTWKTMYIELMTGDNFNMVHLTTVATVDGTDASKASYSWTCPEVDPYSAIYFYQFSSPASKQLVWTTRFTIADKDGNSVAPPNATQPGGADIPWGTGRLVDASLANPAPTDVGSLASASASGSSGASSGASSASASASASDSAAAAPVTTAAAGPSSVVSSGGAAATGASASASSSGIVKAVNSSARASSSASASATAGNASASGAADGTNAAAAPAIKGAGAFAAAAVVGALAMALF